MDDLESSDSWLAKLYELNAVVAACDEPVAGNMFYDHNQADYLEMPPVAFNRMKRDRFRRACAGRTCMLEIGVNAGHSAYLALSSSPSLEFHGVDIGDHSYVRPAVDWLKAQFPGRVSFYEGDCMKVLPELAKRELRPDLFHIDGAKYTYTYDILNCHRMLDGQQALVIVDDVNMASVEQVWQRSVRQGLVEAVPDFPAMPGGEGHRNEIGKLRPLARWRWSYYLRTALLRRSLRRLRRRLRRGN